MLCVKGDQEICRARCDLLDIMCVQALMKKARKLYMKAKEKFIPTAGKTVNSAKKNRNNVEMSYECFAQPTATN